MARGAIVRLDGVRIGSLTETPSGVIFAYDAQYLAVPGAVPVSLTLPLRAEPYLTSHLHPFFLNLLPEGWLLEIATSKLKVGKDDPFGLLVATCADCAGAVEILPEEAAEKG